MKTSVLKLGNLIQGFKLSCQTAGISPESRAFLRQSCLLEDLSPGYKWQS